MDAAAALRAVSVTFLAGLGVHEPDRATVAAWAHAVAADQADLAVVERLCRDVLARDLGAFDEVGGRPELDPALRCHPLGEGVLPLCAFLVTAPDVREHHRVRGVPEGVSRRSLHDLGQQIAKHRHVYGRTGLHNQDWLRRTWAGGYLWIGRLQFELTRSSLGVEGAAERVLALHIPQTGPLTPAAVDAALAAASGIFARCYPEAGPIRAVMCHSWLLDAALPAELPGSNIAAFGDRFTRWFARNGDRDALYFAFDVEPDPAQPLPGPLDALPADSRLRRALLDRWRSGGHVETTSGWLPTPPA